jgi:5-formyltetrahydrofolate cyclo-ligase
VAIPDSTDPKSTLRKAMRRVSHGGAGDSQRVCDTAVRWLSERPALQTVAVFSALPGEPDLSELPARLSERRIVYPKVVGDHLTFHAVANPRLDLAPGAFGILEPVPSLAEVPAQEIDAFLCPGIAFDPRGGRLGRGRGFYDRLLAKARPHALKVGVCFPSQIVPDTFMEPHDIPMDAVLTPNSELPDGTPGCA